MAEAINALKDTAKIHSRVYNEECVYSFQNPFHNEGIYVSLQNGVGVAPRYAQYGLFIQFQYQRRLKETTDESAPTKLGLGTEGGFSSPHYDVEKSYTVLLVKDSKTTESMPYTDAAKGALDPQIVKSIDSIIQHTGTVLSDAAQAWNLDEEIPISKYAADLPFVDNGIKISPNPSDWKCQKTGDTENLWLNLSTGYIGGGRKNWDGSGGSNGALDHYAETGKLYPLVVKLGTISSEGGDCYSYAEDEDGPVKVPNLADLLAKRGIHIAQLQKTEKSTAELEVELNANYNFDAITEGSAELEPVSGPNLQGLKNLGNSCYMNSVVQLLASLPEFSKRYRMPRTSITPTSAPDDVGVQTCKVVSALSSGEYTKTDQQEQEDDPRTTLAPRMLKHVVGKNHVDFCTNQQQDAAQFLQYYLELVDRREAQDQLEYNTSYLFGFATEDRLVCPTDQAVKYRKGAVETIWSLRLPMETLEAPQSKKLKSEDSKDDEMKDVSEDKEEVPSLTLEACLQAWAAPTTAQSIEWSHLGAKHDSEQTSRLVNFPRYLLIQAQRYTLGDDWVPKKLEVLLQVPDELDLTPYKSSGPQANEIVVTDDDNGGGGEEPAVDEAAVGQLMDMGFSRNACLRALTAVGGSNVEAAMGWVFEHNTDPDFNDPLPTSGGSKSSSNVDEGTVQTLVASLGCFTADQVRAALSQTDGQADRAADWLFSHMDDLDGAIKGLEKKEPEDGPGLYELSGMVSHIGKNTGSGHYVAHLKKNGRWIIFNDEKVAVSANPPKEHAYFYLFQRKDTIGSPHSGY